MLNIFSIASSLKKLFSRKDVIFVALIIAVYFATRLIKLESFPIFTDEGIYINWAKIAWKDASWRFISLTDGRQPLQTWGTIPYLKLLPDNPLLAGRLFSATSGFAALAGLFALLFYLFGKRAAYWGSFFYIFTPFFLFYDRMALADSAVNAGFVWILFGSIVLVKTLRLDIALILGMAFGMTLLAKSSSRLFIGLSAFAPLLRLKKNKNSFLSLICNFYFLFFISCVVAFAIYNVQRLSPYLHFVAEKNKTFVMTFAEFLQSPFKVFFYNVKIIPYYIVSESAYVLVTLGLVGLYMLFRKNARLAAYIALWILLPFLAISFFAKVIYPRYLIFFVTIFLVTASFLMVNIKNKKSYILYSIFYILSIAYFDYTILFDHPNIPFPEVDRGQYIESYNSGWGVNEIIDFARVKSSDKPVVLLAEGNFGVIGDMLNASLTPADSGKVSIKGYWPLDRQNLIENQSLLKEKNVLVVFSHRIDFPADWPMKKIGEYRKPGNKSAFYLFELLKK